MTRSPAGTRPVADGLDAAVMRASFILLIKRHHFETHIYLLSVPYFPSENARFCYDAFSFLSLGLGNLHDRRAHRWRDCRLFDGMMKSGQDIGSKGDLRFSGKGNVFVMLHQIRPVCLLLRGVFFLTTLAVYRILFISHSFYLIMGVPERHGRILKI